MSTRRPNFILFITDQHRADHLGCYGHPVLRTPAIDGLAVRGIRFDNSHVASPVCMPNRASLMTSRLPSAHGVRMNGIPLSRNSVTFVELLQKAGYQTALVGKSHLQNFTELPVFGSGPGEREPARRIDLTDPFYHQESPSFWENERAELKTPFYGFDHVDLITGHGDGCGGAYRQWLRAREPNFEKLIGASNQLPHGYSCPQAVRTALPAELYSTTYVAERAENYLSSATEGPFFLMVSFPDPHHPFNPPGRYWDAYRPEDMLVPVAFERPDWTPPPAVAAVLAEREAGTAMLNGMNSFGCSLQEALEARALTCGMIEMIDDAVDRVLRALDRSGHADETVVAFTSDHGDHLGDHRLLLKGAEHYRDITRVPLIWADPAGRRGESSAAIVQTHDLPATILERAGVTPATGMQGQSFLNGIGRDAALIQYEHQKPNAAFAGPPRLHSLVDKRWRISVPDGVDWGELYDLEADPGEFDNLWDDPNAATVKADLVERLLRLEIASVDRFPQPTGRA